VKTRAFDDAQLGGDHVVPEYSVPWPKQGPASYFPSTEKKYGRPISEWQKFIADCGIDKHTAIVNYLKSEYARGQDTPTLSSAGRWRVTKQLLKSEVGDERPDLRRSLYLQAVGKLT
jgi:hypothetical protein